MSGDVFFVGIDAEEISRCEKIAESRVFTAAEKLYSRKRGMPRRPRPRIFV